MSLRNSPGARTIWIMALVAVVALAAGLGLSQFIRSPAEAAADARPPAAGPITVPVESRIIANDVTIRGDAKYDDATPVRVEANDGGALAVVTGHVPEVGTTLDAASVALEVAGRPVIALVGSLPTYRSLTAGVSGPDVLQLKAALKALGIDAGDPASDTYDAKTAAGVIALYQKVGYEPPVPTKALKESVDAARQQLSGAQESLASAQRALTTAKAGPKQSEILRLDADVNAAQRALDDKIAACAAPQPAPDPTQGDSGMTTECTQSAIDNLRDALAITQAARSEASAAPDTSAESAAVSSAADQVTQAKTALTEAETQTLTSLPASEVIFLPSLPRRVDEVSVKRGATVSGSVMSVSGATLQIVASAAASDAGLLTVGSVGSITVDGEEVPVTVTEITKGTKSADTTDTAGGGGGSTSTDTSSSTSGRYTVTLVPGALTDKQLTAVQGSNVRVKIHVSSTGGAVLAVPLAALTAGPGGESRVEVAHKDGTTELVTVEIGLAAGGYVEIKKSAITLAAGDLVVVGTSSKEKASTASPTPAATKGAGG